MNQEVQVVLTLEVNAELSKEQIKSKLEDMINFATLHSTTYERMQIPMINITDIREESEIYETESVYSKAEVETFIRNAMQTKGFTAEYEVQNFIKENVLR